MDIDMRYLIKKKRAHTRRYELLYYRDEALVMMRSYASLTD